MDPGRRRPAFTMVEVLFAMALFGLACVVLMESVRIGLFTLEIVRETRDYDEDYRFVLREVLNIAERDEMEDGGEIDTLGAGEAVWEAELEETNVIDLFELKLTVTFPDTRERFRFTEPEAYTGTFYILRPGWMDQGDYDDLLDEKREALEDARPWQAP
ncbi:MAG: type II secretion system protein [Opitutales bacterium]